LGPSNYLLKRYCHTFPCRCSALKNVLKKRCISEYIVRYLLRIKCKHRSSLSGCLLPYSIFQLKVSKSLAKLGAIRYHKRLFRAVLQNQNKAVFKRLLRKSIPLPLGDVVRYFRSIQVSQPSICMSDAINQLSVPPSQKSFLKFLLKKFHDRDALRLIYEHFLIPSHLAYQGSMSRPSLLGRQIPAQEI
jgi:hypothetical protein